MGTSLRTVETTTLFGTETASRRLRLGDFIELEFKPRVEGEVRLSVLVSRPTPEIESTLRRESRIRDFGSTLGGIRMELFDPAGELVTERVTKGSANPSFVETLAHRISDAEAKGKWIARFSVASGPERICQVSVRFPQAVREVKITPIPILLLERTLKQFIGALGLRMHFDFDESSVDFSDELKSFSQGLLEPIEFSVPIRGLELRAPPSIKFQVRDGAAVIVLGGQFAGVGKVRDEDTGIQLDINRIDLRVELELRGGGEPGRRFIAPVVTGKIKLGEPENLDDAIFAAIGDAQGKAQEKFDKILESRNFFTTVRDYLTEGFIQLAERNDLFHDVSGSADGRDILIHHIRPPVGPGTLDLELGSVGGVVVAPARDSSAGVARRSGRDGPPPPPRRTRRPVPESAADREARRNLDKIDHIVVVMMENRSFDHMLGYLRHPQHENRKDVIGLEGKESHSAPGVANPVVARPLSDTVFPVSPSHEHEPVVEQIAGGAMSGFLESFIKKAPLADFIPSVMGFYTKRHLPFYHFLSENFAICDRWFCSHPGPTFPNRMCTLAGRTLALDNFKNDDPELGYVKLSTIFDLLTAFGVSWTYYERDLGFLRMFDRFRLDARNVLPFEGHPNREGRLVDGFRQRARDGTLPQVTFLDPNFVDIPFGRANDDLAPTDLRLGQRFICRIYNELRNSDLWPRTMLIVTYDEHGGFFDHVPPPGTAEFATLFPDEAPFEFHPVFMPDGTNPGPGERTFYGPRVPAFVVSPFVKKGSVSHTIFDHTSIAKTIVTKFRPNAIPAELGPRVQHANHLGSLLTLAAPANRPLFDCNDMLDSIPESTTAARPVTDPDDLRTTMRRFGIPVRRAVPRA